MPYNLVIQDYFIRSTTSVGSGAFSTTGLGVPTVHNSPSTGGAWEDITGNNWNISSSGRAEKATSNTNVPYNGVIRPHGSAEDMADGRIRIWSTFQNAGDNEVGAVVRFDTSGGGNGYAPLCYAGNFFLFQTVNGGAATQVSGSGTVSTGLSAGADGVFEVITSGTSLTMNMYAAADTTFSSPLGTQTFTGLTKTTAGAWGMCSYDPGHATQVTIEAYSALTPSFVLSPTSATASTPLTVTATGTNTSWVSGTTTFSVTGGTGAGISGLSINNGTQVATFTLNPGSAAGTLTIHDSLDSATATVTVSSAALVGGTAASDFVGKIAVDLIGTAPTGGSGSYTYKWQKSTDGTNFTDIASQTSVASAAVTGLTANTQYWFRCYQNDGTNTVYTNVVNLTTLASSAHVIGAIGDSLTYSVYPNATRANPTAVQSMVTGMGTAGHPAGAYNNGISGSTTADWAPAGGYLTGALAAFVARGVDTVQIMLGTNDAVASVSDTTFNTQLSAINTEVLNNHGLITKVILHYPPAMNSPAHDSDNARLVLYQAKIDALENGTTILAGDKTLYQYGLDNQSLKTDGVHWNQTGYDHQGSVWATANVTALYGGGSTVTSVTVSPSSANVTGGTTLTLSAVVNGTGTPSQSVTWSVSSGVGSINSSTGVYTAPSATLGSQSAVVTATSVQDGSKAGTAALTIPGTGTTITVNTLAPGYTTLGTITDNSVAMTATDATGGTPGYTYQWYLAKSGTGFAPGTDTAVSGATSLSVTLSNLAPGVRYGVQIGYTDAAGRKVYSAQRSFTTLDAITAGDISVTAISPTSVSLTSAVASNGYGSYTYQWQQSADGVTYGNIGGATGTSVTVNSLTPQTTYYFRMVVTDGASATHNSTPVSVTTNQTRTYGGTTVTVKSAGGSTITF